MAYLRRGSKLPSGKASKFFVYGDRSGLSNVDWAYIPYPTLREWFKTKTDTEFKQALEKDLKLNNEELEVVCKRLFEERDKGKWDHPFEFEKTAPPHRDL